MNINSIGVEKSTEYQSKVQAAFIEKIGLQGDNSSDSFNTLGEGASATLEISALGAEELEKARKACENYHVSYLYKTELPIQKNDEGVYRIGKVDFTEEEFGAAQSLIKGMGSQLKTGYLSYRDYAKMEMAETLVDKTASVNFNEEQVAVINKAMRDYNERLIKTQNSMLASTPHRENEDSASGKYFGIMAEVPREVMDVHKGLYGDRFSGTNLASTDVATNQDLTDSLRSSIRDTDVTDKSSVERLKSTYRDMMRPVYSVQYPFQRSADVSDVISRDVDDLMKMIDYANKWQR